MFAIADPAAAAAVAEAEATVEAYYSGYRGGPYFGPLQRGSRLKKGSRRKLIWIYLEGKS